MATILPNGRNQFFDNNGDPLVGGRLWTYLPGPGITTPKNTYSDAAATVPNTNPIILDARGEHVIFWSGGYNVRLETAAGGLIWTVESINTDPTAADINTQIRADLANTVDPAKGAGMVGWEPALAYADGTVGAGLNQAVGLSPSGGFDNANIDAYFAANSGGRLMAGLWRLNAKLTLQSNYKITLDPGVTIQQFTANTPIFEAVTKDGITINCNDAILYGEGAWSPAWVGSGGHNDRAFNMLGCTNLVIDRPHTKNCALAGIALIGGNHIRVNFPTLEGTNLYSTPLPSSANFQFGIYARSDPTYGALNDVVVTGPDVSGTAIGILDELEVASPLRTDAMVVIGGSIHDITGQHGFYLTHSLFNVIGTSLSDIFLAGVKIQAGDANQDIVGVSAIGIQAKNLGSQMFEVAVPVPFTGRIRGTTLQGTANNVLRGISISRRVDNLKADIVVETCTGVGVNIQDDDNHDLDIKVMVRNAALDGIIITATNSDGIKLRPTIRNPNTTTTANCCGIRVASASALVELYEPDVIDASTKMVYGLFNNTAGSDVKVFGRARFTGASDTAVRTTGTISAWPTDTTLSGTNGDFTDTANITGPVDFYRRYTSPTAAANYVLWQRTMPDNSTMTVTVDLSVSKGAGIDRGGYKFVGTFYRQGGGIATLQGAITTLHSQATGTIAITYALQSNGANDVVLLVNPTGAILTKWAARVTVEQAGP